ncbi:hypothetical protein OGAPHI_004925 [Ogataea philodendri]|uniref:Uncharacterized protein n=1 Tax=Ogataea philodendri TaxID=1378263 RepID=A0A9P8P2K4_9ASCO|nr:uncharacterized protein OGAPHI_004925 [Ogataea philodendri]KAH3663524.1 hypothetical protein OGAPHI_004925 [Ogataea philodendri]
MTHFHPKPSFTNPASIGAICQQRNQINRSFTVLLSKRHHDEISNTQEQKTVPGTVVELIDGDVDVWISSNICQNRVNAASRNTTSKDVNHHTEHGQPFTASAPVQRIIRIVGRCRNQHNTLFSLDSVFGVVQVNQMRGSWNR